MGCKSFLDELVLFQCVDDQRTCGWRGGGIPANITNGFLDDRRQTKCEMSPGSHVFRLLLAPDDFCIRGVAGENLRQFLGVEGVDLLQAKNCGVGDFVFSLVILEIVKDFP